MSKIEEGEIVFYHEVEDYLQQADIFNIDVVSPVADTQKRIFRTSDGQHGSVYFEGETQAKVFSEEDLLSHLNMIQRGPCHTDPFVKTSDIGHELVVVGAKKIRYFIVASQTCDISGKDKSELPLCTILPIITLLDLCRLELLPIGPKTCTIHNFILDSYEGEKGELINCDDFKYPGVIRKIIEQWLSVGIKGELDKNVRFIKKYLSPTQKFGNNLYSYYLRADESKGVPESYIDFSSICIVPTFQLNSLKDTRKCRLGSDYHKEFIKKFADFFERVAIPKKMIEQ